MSNSVWFFLFCLMLDRERVNGYNWFCYNIRVKRLKKRRKDERKRCEQSTQTTHSDESNVIVVVAIKTFGTKHGRSGTWCERICVIWIVCSAMHAQRIYVYFVHGLTKKRKTFKAYTELNALNGTREEESEIEKKNTTELEQIEWFFCICLCLNFNDHFLMKSLTFIRVM